MTYDNTARKSNVSLTARTGIHLVHSNTWPVTTMSPRSSRVAEIGAEPRRKPVERKVSAKVRSRVQPQYDRAVRVSILLAAVAGPALWLVHNFVHSGHAL